MNGPVADEGVDHEPGSARIRSTPPGPVPKTGAAIVLRAAEIADLSLLRQWDEQPHVIASAPNDDWQWEDELGLEVEGREQLMAELDGRPIGYVEILDPARDDERYWGDDVQPALRAIDIWIGEADELGKGYGTMMMGLALTRCFAEPTVEAVLVDPIVDNVRAHRFYERIGFRRLGRRRFGEDDCFVYRLTRADWKPDPRHSASG